MVDFSEVFTEIDKKWGKVRMRAFVEAGVNVQPYYDDVSDLVHERVCWYDLEYVLDCMLPLEVTNEKH